MLQKQNVNVNFSQGLDTKTDPFQVQLGKFLTLTNSVFDKAGRLTKRNGFGPLASLPDGNTTYLTTFNGNLTAIGNNLEAYSAGSQMWIDKGYIIPVKLNTLNLIRNSYNQYYTYSQLASNGLICTAYSTNTPGGNVHSYVINDSTTGQNIVPPTVLTNADPTTGVPKVFILGNYFIIAYSRLISSTYHLEYIAVVISDPSTVLGPTDITAQYDPTANTAWDGYVANNVLYLAWNGSDIGGAIRVRFITATLNQSSVVVYSGQSGTILAVTADITGSTAVVYVGFYSSGSQNGYMVAVDHNLLPILAPTQFIITKDVANLTLTAQNQVCQAYFEINSNYTFIGVASNYIFQNTVTQSGTAGPQNQQVVRSVGLASKAFLIDGKNYFLAVFVSSFQPSYFLINASGQVISRLAYSNASGYYVNGLSQPTVIDNVAYINYLVTDTLQAGAKNTAAGVNNPNPIYTQLGISLATFTIGGVTPTASEIGQNLNMSGGLLWNYDGYQPVENNFLVWPEPITLTSTTGGSMSAQQYFYQVTYEWTDNQGNLFRSAPSVPTTITLTSDTAVQIQGPCLRLTYKINNPVRIVIYRWSAAQQVYYQVTSITNPLLNNPNADSFSYIDTLSDAQILGNNILYTTGGVIENISPPATNLITLFNNRLWLVDAEDPNLLWFSKQVIESTPVEMSDLLTIFVAPSTSTEGPVGPITAIAPMDDKLIIFKENALGYISGTGPDNTGSNSGYSDFTLITAAVGCINQNSIVFMPSGLMFQSNKGIWILGRDLSTQYIGAPVEDFTLTATVLSALNIPATNQVRFSMDSGITLMYDYYFGQWGTFTNVPATSSTIYKNLHTYVNSLGQVFQETPGTYLDNSLPVLMSFTSSWVNVAGLQGLQRFYELLLLGRYISPFKLNMQLAYNYNPSDTQATIITPNTPGPNWGGDALWGSNELWGGAGDVFEARLFPQIQKCESFQISMNEIFDNSFTGMGPGAGLTLSGMNLVFGVEKNKRLSPSARSFGK